MSNNNLKLREEVMKGLNVLEKMENPLEIRMLKTKKGTRSGYYIDKNKLLSDIQKYDGVDNIFFFSFTSNNISYYNVNVFHNTPPSFKIYHIFHYILVKYVCKCRVFKSHIY